MTASIIRSLEHNHGIYKELFSISQHEFIRWKPAPEKWCLLEIICHLYDEEREDFKARVNHALKQPDKPPVPIDPQGWVTKRKYMAQDYAEMVDKFLKERSSSVEWLRSLKSPEWQNELYHPELGKMSAKKFLVNWLAHDYLHFRQINRLRYQFLQHTSGQDLSYAGKWPGLTPPPE